MRKLIYRGPEQIARIRTMSKMTYVFERKNAFTVLPSTWADYYELIAFDGTFTKIVDSEDPLAKTDMRRKSQFDYEMPKEVAEKQAMKAKELQDAQLYRSYIESYKRSICDRIASGTLESFPDTYEEDAIQFADEKSGKIVKEPNIPETPEIVVPQVDILPETPASNPETIETPADATPAKAEILKVEPVVPIKKPVKRRSRK